MRRNAWIFVILLGFVSVGGAEAQSTSAKAAADKQLAREPKVEIGASAGLISATTGQDGSPYQDDWYGHGRYAGSIAYYWTRHLKTEFEHQWSGEGTSYYNEFTLLNGVPYPYGVQRFHQLQQSSLKLVWQFGENEWVHPYVSAGAVLDMERQHSYGPPVYQPSNRSGPPVLLQNAIDSERRTDFRTGWTIGGGAKFYVTKNAFVNAGFIGTRSKPAATVNAILGFGVDF